MDTKNNNPLDLSQEPVGSDADELYEHLQQVNTIRAAPPAEKALISDLLQELEESIPQGVPNDTQYRRRETDPKDEVLDTLDALLAESLAGAEAERQYRADVKARQRGFSGMTKEEVDFCNSRLAAFEMARMWVPDEAIGVWTRFTCAKCGCYHVVFSRYMEHHKHKTNPTASRWLMVQEVRESLREQIGFVREDREVPTCEDCEEISEEVEMYPTLKEVIGS